MPNLSMPGPDPAIKYAKKIVAPIVGNGQDRSEVPACQWKRGKKTGWLIAGKE